ncbi:MAG: RnfH family protein [Woeseiaceae bacterium]
MAEKIHVEVVFATPQKQVLLTLSLPAHSTVADALSESALSEHFPDIDFDRLQAGVWGHLVQRDRVLLDGDRVEIYRPLGLDPKESRRQLAILGRTMSGRSTD